MTAIHDDKYEDEIEKNITSDDVQAVRNSAVEMPESLQGLTEEEMAAIAKRVVRKADLVLMYASTLP